MVGFPGWQIPHMGQKWDHVFWLSKALEVSPALGGHAWWLLRQWLRFSPTANIIWPRFGDSPCRVFLRQGQTENLPKRLLCLDELVTLSWSPCCTRRITCLQTSRPIRWTGWSNVAVWHERTGGLPSLTQWRKRDRIHTLLQCTDQGTLSSITPKGSRLI